jgi:hypothetical protein
MDVGVPFHRHIQDTSGVHIGQIFRNEAYAGHQLQTRAAKMAKALMYGSQSALLPLDHDNKGFL